MGGANSDDQLETLVLRILCALSPSPISELDQQYTGRLRKGDNLPTGEGGGDGGGAKSYDGEKAWPSINHSILSAPNCPLFQM